MSTPAADSPARRPPTCPRCGYDLAGAVAAWGGEACPMNGLCSECGHAFEWSDVLSPVRHRLHWLYEHAPRWWSARSAVATLLLALLPNVFWRKVQAHHRVSPRRLAVWPVALLLAWSMLWSLAFMPFQIWHAFKTPGMSFDVHRFEGFIARSWSIQFGFEYGWWISSQAPLHLWLIGAFSAGASAIAIAAPSFYSRSRVRRVHIARIAVYTLAPGLAFHALWSALWLVAHATLLIFENSKSVAGLKWSNMAFSLAEFLTSMPMVFAMLAVLLWQALAWPFALRRGLRMTPGATAALGALCIFTGLLAAFTAMVGIQP